MEFPYCKNDMDCYDESKRKGNKKYSYRCDGDVFLKDNKYKLYHIKNKKYKCLTHSQALNSLQKLKKKPRKSVLKDKEVLYDYQCRTKKSKKLPRQFGLLRKVCTD